MTLKSIWVDYCENGSINGLRHIIQENETPWKRLMWILLLIVASIAIVVLVSASWEKYSYSSMEIAVDDPRYPLSKIDFPAVTVCPISKIIYSKALKLVLDKHSNDSDLRTRWTNSLMALARMQFPHNTNLFYFLKNTPTIKVPLDDISDLMLKLAPSIEDIFIKCFWRGVVYKCKDILRFQRTEQGFCYSFNSQTAERSTNDVSNINPPFDGPDGILIPLRNNAAGKNTGLKLIMSNMSNEFFPTDNLIHPDMVDEVETMLSGGESDNDDYDVFSDRENEVPVEQNPETYEIIPGVQFGSKVHVDNLNYKYYKKSTVRTRLYLVCHRKNNNDWPFCSATASINLETPGYLTLNKRHNHGPEVINKPVSFFREAVSKRVLAPGTLSSSVRLVYNQEIVNHPEAAEDYTCLQTQHRVKRQRHCRRPPNPYSLNNLVEILNNPIHNKYNFFKENCRWGKSGNCILEAISKYREELGTVEVAGIDGTFKTLPKSPPELKKRCICNISDSIQKRIIRYSRLKLNSVYHLFQTNPVAARFLRKVLAIPHLPAERGNPDCPQHDIYDGCRAIMNYVQQFPDIEQQLRPFLVGYIERYWLTQVLVHPPDGFPDVTSAYKVHAERDRITQISVSVAQVEADDSLNRLDNRNGQCYLYKAKAKNLNSLLHKSSNEDTCFIKCRMRAIYEACNCTQYFFKLYKGLGSHCGIEHIPCLVDNDILQRNAKVMGDEPGFPEWSIPFSMHCDCRPPCSFITYTTELRYEIRQFINNEPSSSRYDVFLEVNYRELYATSYRRSMRYTTQDLLGRYPSR
ncbi:hypothetical protein ACI65C_004758 [Semiaphis heraclei]